MISDVLLEAVREIDRYRKDPNFSDCYSDPALARWIDRVRNDMNGLRRYLDMRPADPNGDPCLHPTAD